MLDLNKIQPEKAIAILQFCQKYNVSTAEIGKLLEIVGSKAAGRPPGIKEEQPSKQRGSQKAAPLKHDYKALRVAKGVSQAVAAEMSGVGLSSIPGIESGKTIPRKETLDKLNAYYGVTDDEN